MKIDNASSTNLVFKGSIENAQRYIQGKEVERQQANTETQSTTSAFMDPGIQGSVFDAKA